ncbi:MAG: hypothetical protein R2772_03845 [Chitinophagales bacterium]
MLPSLAWNNYDKTQVGLALGIKLKDKFNFLALPMYGTGSKNFTGYLETRLNLQAKTWFSYSLGLQAKRFSYLLFPEDLCYNLLQPELSISPIWKNNARLSFKYKPSLIWQEYLLGGRKTQFFYINRAKLSYQVENSKWATYNLLALEQGNNFGIISLKSSFKFKYQRKIGNALHLDAYIGNFLWNKRLSSNIDAPLPILQLSGSTNSGIYWLQKDYAFQDFYLDRNAQDKFFSKQQNASEGGFTCLTNLANVNGTMLSFGARTDVGLGLKLKRYFNIQGYLHVAYAKNKKLDGDVYAESGLSLLLWQEVFAFHLPFYLSKNIKENQRSIYGIEKGDWTKRITFSIDLLSLRRKLEN